MAQQYNLEVNKRQEKGKGSNRRLRRNGFLPGVYYDKKGENHPVTVPYGPFESVYEKAHKSNIIYLKISDGHDASSKPVLIWDVQEHPVKKLILHVDFLGVDLKEEMDVDVPVTVSGKAKGEEEGGVVYIFRDAIPVTCLPTAIPDEISIDVTNLDINDNIYLLDIQLPEGVVLQEQEENYAVVGVAPPEKPEELEEEAEEEEEISEGEEEEPGESTESE